MASSVHNKSTTNRKRKLLQQAARLLFDKSITDRSKWSWRLSVQTHFALFLWNHVSVTVWTSNDEVHVRLTEQKSPETLREDAEW